MDIAHVLNLNVGSRETMHVKELDVSLTLHFGEGCMCVTANILQSLHFEVTQTYFSIWSFGLSWALYIHPVGSHECILYCKNERWLAMNWYQKISVWNEQFVYIPQVPPEQKTEKIDMECVLETVRSRAAAEKQCGEMTVIDVQSLPDTLQGSAVEFAIVTSVVAYTPILVQVPDEIEIPKEIIRKAPIKKASNRARKRPRRFWENNFCTWQGQNFVGILFYCNGNHFGSKIYE